MEISPTLLMIAGFIIILLGIGAGLLIASLTEEEEPVEQGAAGAPQSPPGARKGRYKPLARLWRDGESGALVVEMDGKSFLGPQAMSQPQRAGLEHAARDLRGWLGMGLAQEPAPATSVAARQEVVGSATPVAPTPVAPTPVAPTPVAPAPVLYSPPAPGVSAIPPAGLDDAAKAAAPRSIVMQIEDILQDMIAGSEAARQGLHLHEDPIRGVIVTWEGKSYEGIDAVPEGDAKRAIRAAVAEWEKTQ
jgi:hypothetical protein